MNKQQIVNSCDFSSHVSGDLMLSISVLKMQCVGLGRLQFILPADGCSLEVQLVYSVVNIKRVC